MTEFDPYANPSLMFMGCDSFSSMDDFREKLRQYQRDSGTAFVTFCSRSPASYKRKKGNPVPPTVEYSWVQYVCIHSGRRGRKTKPNTRFADCNCPATINLVWDPVNERMKLTRVDLRHSHETVQEFPEVYAKNRRLTQSQEDEVFRLTDSFHSPKEIRYHIKERFGISLTGYDVRNLRRKRQSTVSEVNELLSSINDIILQMDSERCNAEMHTLYAYLDKLKEALQSPEPDFDLQTSAILGLPPQTAQKSSVPSASPTCHKAKPVRILPKVQLANVSCTSVTVPQIKCGVQSLASLKNPSETSPSISTPSTFQLISIPSSQLSTINFSSTYGQSMATSDSVQPVDKSSQPSPQVVVIPSTIQLASMLPASCSVTTRSDPSRSVDSVSGAGTVPLVVRPSAPGQPIGESKKYVVSGKQRRTSSPPCADDSLRHVAVLQSTR